MAELTLKWEKFGLGKLLHEMLGSRELVDVTLACQGEFIKAHKTVLAAGSPYFREIFKDNPCTHPVVILQDINLTHLKTIVQFMYLGEVTVLQEQLPGFLQTAEVLGVSALVPKNKKSQAAHPTTHSSTQPSNAELPLEDSSQLIRRRRRNLKHTPTKCMPTPESLEPQIQIKDSPSLLEKFNSDPGQNDVPPNANVNDLGLYSSEEIVVVPDDVKLEGDDDEAFSWPMSPLADTEMSEVDPRPTDISADELSAVIPMDIPCGNSVTITKRGHSSARGSSSSHQGEHWMLQSSPNPHLDNNQLLLSNSGVELITEASVLGTKVKKHVSSASASINDPSTSSHTNPGGTFMKMKLTKPNVTKVAKVRGRFLKCVKCRETFPTRALRIEHEEKIHQIKGTLVTCEFCHRKFNHNKSLCTHRRLYHTGPDAGVRHVCKTCGVSYALKGDLKTHERNIHGDLAKPHQCQICFKVFKNRRYCHSHMRVIHQMREFPNNATPA